MCVEYRSKKTAETFVRARGRKLVSCKLRKAEASGVAEPFLVRPRLDRMLRRCSESRMVLVKNFYPRYERINMNSYLYIVISQY